MTVCIAAMGQNQKAVVCASDRMISYGDVQFEPRAEKLYGLTTAIVLMTAGDTPIQTEAQQLLREEIDQRIKDQPEDWWGVRNVAALYVKHIKGIRHCRAETAVLSPLGLDYKSFLTQQASMSSSFVEQVTTALIRFQLPATSAIIAGVDSTDYAHIYSVQGTTSMCADHVGFASIGMGAWHANSQLMLARHDKLRPLEETLRLVYAAKKRSEVAPGVGRDTDMVVVGFPLGNFIRVEGKPLKSFQRIHENAEKAIQRVEDRAQRETKKYLDGLADQTQPKDQAGDAEAVSDPNKKAD